MAAAAKAAGLNWTPDSNRRLVTVARAATYVPADVVMTALTRTVAAQTGKQDIMVQILGRVPQLAVATGAAPTVRVDQMQYDPGSGQFSAVLLAPANDPDARPVPVQGRVTEALQVPVPAGRIDTGQVIRKSDLRWISVPAERVDRNAITDLTQLVGKAARHALPEGWPIHTNDVQRPSLVTKGALVTVTLQTSNMSLSTVGRAMEAGGQGDLIQVQNMQSHKTIIGTVVGPNLIAVQNSRIVSASR